MESITPEDAQPEITPIEQYVDSDYNDKDGTREIPPIPAQQATIY
jgi:hypothetical protein